METTSKPISDADLDKVVQRIFACYAAKQKTSSAGGSGSPERILVAIAGRPGSGKTTVAIYLAEALQRRWTKPTGAASEAPSSLTVCVMPMDGYHLYRKELRAMPNAEEAIRRRGAEWTFNPIQFNTDLRALRTRSAVTGAYEDVRAPSFDHGVGDPCEGGICIPKHAGVVLVEGNYVLYRGTPEWAAVNDNFDLNLFLHCPRDRCTERLCRRHMAAWSIPRAEAMVRAQGSDTTNGDLVDTTRERADEVMVSIDYGASRSSKL